MGDLGFTNLLAVAMVAFAAPLVLGLVPALRVPSVVVELVAGIVIGPAVLGWDYAPKLVFGIDSGGEQEVTLDRGRLRFRGAVDFAPTQIVRPGPGPSAFPPSQAQPGAVGEARLQLLDGWQGGDRRYYHLVTDSSDPVAATIELGVYAPRLANLVTFGQSNVFDRSALLAFSPNANGETGVDDPERQGLNSTIVDGDRDPVNVFPLDPDNDRRFHNNYSPMWDAHIAQWTDEAIASGQRRAIRGFDDLRDLVARGLVTSFAGSTGPENGFVAGLRASNAIINCPVIAQPFERNDADDDATPFRP